MPGGEAAADKRVALVVKEMLAVVLVVEEMVAVVLVVEEMVAVVPQVVVGVEVQRQSTQL